MTTKKLFDPKNFLTWRDVFDPSKKMTLGSHIKGAVKLTKSVNYKYFCWNGWIYDAKGNNTGKEIRDIK